MANYVSSQAGQEFEQAALESLRRFGVRPVPDARPEFALARWLKTFDGFLQPALTKFGLIIAGKNQPGNAERSRESFQHRLVVFTAINLHIVFECGK